MFLIKQQKLKSFSHTLEVFCYFLYFVFRIWKEFENWHSSYYTMLQNSVGQKKKKKSNNTGQNKMIDSFADVKLLSNRRTVGNLSLLFQLFNLHFKQTHPINTKVKFFKRKKLSTFWHYIRNFEYNVLLKNVLINILQIWSMLKLLVL